MSLSKNHLKENNAITSNSENKSICTNKLNNNISCKCDCPTTYFLNITQTTNEIRKERCRILNNVSELQLNRKSENWRHVNCNCDNVQQIRESKIQNLNENEYIKSTSEISNVDDWSSKLIGFSRFKVLPTSIRERNDPFKAVPSVKIVPPTPDDNTCNRFRKAFEQQTSEQSPEDSPQDELPYQAFNTTLKRYGTISSLGLLFLVKQIILFTNERKSAVAVKCGISHALSHLLL